MQNSDGLDTEYESGRKTIKDLTLPFNDHKQVAYLGHCLDPRTGFLKQILPFADKGWFTNPVAGEVFEAIQRFVKEYPGDLPTQKSLSEWTKLTRDTDMLPRMQSVISRAAELATQYSLKMLQDETMTWMQAKIIQNAAMRASACYNAKPEPNLVGAVEAMTAATKLFRDARFTLGNFKDLSDYAGMIEGQGAKSTVAFGLRGIDDVLFPKNAMGGLRLGDQTLIMSPANMGKTTTLITVLIHNVINNKRCLLVAHEGRDSDLQVKILRCFFALVPLQKIREILMQVDAWVEMKFDAAKLATCKRVADNPQSLGTFYAAMRRAGESINDFLDVMSRVNYTFMTLMTKVTFWLNQHLVFACQNKAFLKVEEVLPVIERAAEDMHDRYGENFDIVADDYPGILQTELNSKGNYQARQVMDAVYLAFSQTALEKKWHSIVAIQTNREGSKKANGYNGIQWVGKPKEIYFLRNEDVAESFGPIMSATNVITINRSPAALAGRYITYYIAKSRSSMTGVAVTVYERLDKCVSHADEFGWISYTLGNEDRRIITQYLKPGGHDALRPDQVAACLQEQQGIDVDEKHK